MTDILPQLQHGRAPNHTENEPTPSVPKLKDHHNPGPTKPHSLSLLSLQKGWTSSTNLKLFFRQRLSASSLHKIAIWGAKAFWMNSCGVSLHWAIFQASIGGSGGFRGKFRAIYVYFHMTELRHVWSLQRLVNRWFWRSWCLYSEEGDRGVYRGAEKGFDFF